jgi:hypothetical protein
MEIYLHKINEIPKRKYLHHPETPMWVFYVTIKKQIIYA